MSAAVKFRSQFTARNLRNLYLEKIRDSSATGIDRIQPHKLQAILPREILVILRKVASCTYKFTPYKERLISKGQGKSPRVISIPTARDRLVLRALFEVISHSFEDAKLRLPQVVIDSLCSELSSGRFSEYVKIDLQDFYGSVPHDLLIGALRRRIRKPEIIALVRAAIETATVPERKGGVGSRPRSRGVPQGLAISNILAEISVAKFDSLYKDRSDIWYCRYVDDILILTRAGSAERIGGEIVDQLTSLGFSPHALDDAESKSKVGELVVPFSYLGYEVSASSLCIRRESVLKFEASLAGIFTAFRHKYEKARSASAREEAIRYCEWRLNLRITGCIFKGKRLGWVFYFSQISDTTQLRVVGNTIQSMLERFGLAGRIRVKSLLKTHYESMRRDTAGHKYIPNFDRLPVAERRKILIIILGERRIAGLTDRRINELFEMRIGIAVRELEADLSSIS